MKLALLVIGLLASVVGAKPADAQLLSSVDPGVSYRGAERKVALSAADSLLDGGLPAMSRPLVFEWSSPRRAEQSGEMFPLWMAPLFSAVVPGTGQLRLGKNRFAAYLAIEAYGWIRFARHRADARRDRDGYRLLAADVARSLFSADRPLGDFDYYERMEKFIESGVFDAGEENEIQPEPDETTYNGFIWRRARDTFWDDPITPSSRAYERSIEYYRENAVTSEYRWSWRNAQLEHDQFKRTIAGSNDAFRRSVQDLGLILGNHVLSMVDAFVTVRLRASGAGVGRSYSLVATIPARAPAP